MARPTSAVDQAAGAPDASRARVAASGAGGRPARGPGAGADASPGHDLRGRHGLGIVLNLASAIAYSTSGFWTRLIPLDPWTILFWRGLFAGVFIGGVIVWLYRRRTLDVVRGIGAPGLAAACLSTLATIMYINAFRRTSVADVMIMNATTPFIAATVGWLWLRERERWSTLAASAVALVGTMVMVGGSVREGHLTGDLLAFGMAVCMAGMMLLIRRHRETPMMPAACLSALLCPAFVWPFAHPGAAGGVNMLYLVLFGVTQFGLGLLLLTLGARLISATETALIQASEVPLGPLWVWFAFREVPPLATWIGGAIILAAVAGHVYASRQPSSAKQSAPRSTPDGAAPARR
ncbi:MAG TPA: DMT family transporter [bacterium]|nr:DMT family transporter [bacterium]